MCTGPGGDLLSTGPRETYERRPLRAPPRRSRRGTGPGSAEPLERPTGQRYGGVLRDAPDSLVEDHGDRGIAATVAGGGARRGGRRGAGGAGPDPRGPAGAPRTRAPPGRAGGGAPGGGGGAGPEAGP